ncbi:4Fe-4S domain-containing protein [Streptomyces sp. BK239]|uniref:4Fe-4S domain-containing protein n=1 Tax=Streptomyces sp. BK239 TaxID=2512155 RepID=UPI00387EA3BF
MGEERFEDGWWVDERCTNCDAARQLAPGLIGEVDGRSVVLRQPSSRAELRQLNAAAHACPTRSIRPPAGRLEAAQDPFPMALDDTVHLCGHNSTHTAGANSYLLRRPDGTTMMVDTPRWSTSLAARYEGLGPVTDVLLTHRDHAAHGRRYADRFGARLWIHEGDLDARPGRRPCASRHRPSEDRRRGGRLPLPGAHPRQRAVPRGRAVLLQRRQLLLVARYSGHRGGRQCHLVLHQ